MTAEDILINQSIYKNALGIPSKLIQEDGTITDFQGNIIENPTNEYWKNQIGIPNKVILADGTYTTLPTVTDGSGGTTNHALLTNRNALNQHPISSITNLTEELQSLQDDINTKVDNNIVDGKLYARRNNSWEEVIIPTLQEWIV